jgi:hypothetical protein
MVLDIAMPKWVSIWGPSSPSRPLADVEEIASAVHVGVNIVIARMGLISVRCGPKGSVFFAQGDFKAKVREFRDDLHRLESVAT